MDFFKTLNATSKSRRGPPPALPTNKVVIRTEYVKEKKKAPGFNANGSSKSIGFRTQRNFASAWKGVCQLQV
jgi:hypothetical protein